MLSFHKLISNRTIVTSVTKTHFKSAHHIRILRYLGQHHRELYVRLHPRGERGGRLADARDALWVEALARLFEEFEDALADVPGHGARVEIQYVVLDCRLAEELKHEISKSNLHFAAYIGRLCD